MHYVVQRFCRQIYLKCPYHKLCLSFIDAIQLMVFHNKLDQLDFLKQQDTALEILIDFMFVKGITVIEHDALFIADAIFANENYLAISDATQKQENCEPRKV